jgi:hypothetical protein
MHIKSAFLAALILCGASPARAAFEEEEVAYILFGVGKQDLSDGRKASGAISLNMISNSLQIEPADKNWYLLITRRGDCIYDVEHGQIAHRGPRYNGQFYYVDLSNLSAVEVSGSYSARSPNIKVIGGHVGCPINMRFKNNGCTINRIGVAEIKSVNNFARSFSQRFCGGFAAKKLV